MSTSATSSVEYGTGTAAVSAITAHHEALVGELHEHVTAVRAAAADDGLPSAVERLDDFLTRCVLPHARAEERTLYRAAERGPAALLVAAMRAEHEALTQRARDLSRSLSSVDAVAVAAEIEALFVVHVAKENDLLLPALVADDSVNLTELLEQMHHDLGEGPEAEHSAPPAELDVRALEHKTRHEAIFARLDALDPGDSLVVVNDHDPAPLHYQIDALSPGRFGWSYVEAGPDRWRVAITRAS